MALQGVKANIFEIRPLKAALCVTFCHDHFLGDFFIVCRKKTAAISQF